MFDISARFLTSAHKLPLQFTINIALLCVLSGNVDANTPPHSDAGADQSAAEHTSVQLDGSNSSDSDGQITSYRWFQTRGPLVSLDDKHAVITHFQAPANAQLEFRLRVVDDTGAKDSDRVLIQVEPYTNQPPQANAGPDQSVAPGTTVQLSSLGSADSDGTIIRQKWIQTRGPIVSLADKSSPETTFIMPENSQLVFRLKLEDNAGAVARDIVKITSNPYANEKPLANAGPDQSVPQGTAVVLDAVASTDTDGAIVLYRWTQTNGPDMNLIDSQTSTARFTADTAGEYEFKLKIEDDQGGVKTDYVLITVLPDLQRDDSDLDGIPDSLDTFPADPGEAYDFDRDGIGDSSDSDRDGDGIDNANDYFPDDPTQNQPPVLTITSPLQGANIDNDTVLVTGTLTAPINTGVTVNGIVAHLGGNPYGSEFAATVPLQTGNNSLTITATLLNRKQLSQTLIISRSGDNLLNVTASPNQAFAPAEVEFTITDSGQTGIQMVELDYDGDNITDRLITFDQILAGTLKNPITHTYTEPGLYQPVITIIDRDNNSHREDLSISIQDKGQIDQIIRELWGSMNAALVAGNHGLATESITDSSMSGYSRIFYLLLPHMNSIVSGYTDIAAVDIGLTYGEYAVGEEIDGSSRIFLIQFMQDYKGVWRLEGM
jgi:hypothetical protein